jgi:hypothetical protein
MQAFVAPVRDLRYIASFGGAEGIAGCTTFARRFSLRYTHAYDDGLVAPMVRQKASLCATGPWKRG